jgi:hypothetical protein
VVRSSFAIRTGAPARARPGMPEPRPHFPAWSASSRGAPIRGCRLRSSVSSRLGARRPRALAMPGAPSASCRRARRDARAADPNTRSDPGMFARNPTHAPRLASESRSLSPRPATSSQACSDCIRPATGSSLLASASHRVARSRAPQTFGLPRHRSSSCSGATIGLAQPTPFSVT